MMTRQQKQELSWQHPYVDVFRVFNVFSFSECTKRGDVKTIKDKFLKLTVFRISGRVSASNFVKIPKDHSKIKMKLTGKYTYLKMRSQTNRDATIYLDVTTNKGHNVRVTIGTRFEKSECRDLNVNVPLTLDSKWTMVAVDLQSIISNALNQDFKYTRNITLGSNMYVRGTYTSDIAYTETTLPSKMRFPKVKGNDGPAIDFIWIPNIPKDISSLRVPLQSIAALPRAPASMWTDLRKLGMFSKEGVALLSLLLFFLLLFSSLFLSCVFNITFILSFILSLTHTYKYTRSQVQDRSL